MSASIFSNPFAFADPFDLLMNKVCSVLTSQSETADAYGQKTQRPQDFTSLADNVPCRISDKVTGRAHELKVDKQLSESFKTIMMRPPILSDGSRLNPHHWIITTGTLDPTTGVITPLAAADKHYYNVFEVQSPSGMDHHYEIIVQLVLP